MARLKQITGFLRDLWSILGITLLLFALVEGGSSAVSLIRHKLPASTPHLLDRRLRADAYTGSSWARDYFREFHESSFVRWEPYVYWRRKAYSGKYINVDADGIRVTPQAVTPDGSGRPLRVFMFGGSAMWGTGARDPFTIPALLARELVKRGVEARVTNFGETGYVSTQEIIELLLQLQRGNVPDLVIFYDGANDAFSAYQQGSAGLPMNEIHRVAEFNLTNRRMVKDLIRTAATATIDRLSTVRFVQGVLGRLLGSRAVNPPIGTSASGRGDPASLAEQVMRVHAANMDVAGALSATYGFKCLSYWQPTIFGKRELSKYEEGERQRGEQKTDGVVEATYSLAHEIQTESCGKEPLHDLSAVFTSVQEPMFIDWVHLDERGNRIIAERMVEDVLGVLHASIAEGSTTRTSGHAR